MQVRNRRFLEILPIGPLLLKFDLGPGTLPSSRSSPNFKNNHVEGKLLNLGIAACIVPSLCPILAPPSAYLDPGLSLPTSTVTLGVKLLTERTGACRRANFTKSWPLCNLLLHPLLPVSRNGPHETGWEKPVGSCH